MHVLPRFRLFDAIAHRDGTEMFVIAKALILILLSFY